MKPTYNEKEKRLTVALEPSDSLTLLEGTPITAQTARKVGEQILTVHVLPRVNEKYLADVPIGDPQHLANLRGGTSGVHIEGSTVKVWLSRTLVASNQIASENTRNITAHNADTDISEVKITLPELSTES